MLTYMVTLSLIGRWPTWKASENRRTGGELQGEVEVCDPEVPTCPMKGNGQS